MPSGLHEKFRLQHVKVLGGRRKASAVASGSGLSLDRGLAVRSGLFGSGPAFTKEELESIS